MAITEEFLASQRARAMKKKARMTIHPILWQRDHVVAWAATQGALPETLKFLCMNDIGGYKLATGKYTGARKLEKQDARFSDALVGLRDTLLNCTT